LKESFICVDLKKLHELIDKMIWDSVKGEVTGYIEQVAVLIGVIHGTTRDNDIVLLCLIPGKVAVKAAEESIHVTHSPDRSLEM
jgi:hypothetical protein